MPEKKLDRQFADTYIDKHVNNKKGKTFPERFIDVLSDPNNLFIKRCADAGKIKGDYVVLHNGLLVNKRGYYESFSKIFHMNKGVHEPAEERMFGEVLQYIPEGAVIIELGAYWAFYSMWFFKAVANAKVYCVEPSKNNMQMGIDNCVLNNVKADFTQGKIGANYNGQPDRKKDNLSVRNFAQEKGIEFIDILHSDIQGSELEMLNDIAPLLDEKKVGYLFVSTHAQELHYSCVDLLKKHDYRIVASADFANETFCFDGIIVACHKDNMDIPYTSLGNRKHTPLRKKCMI